MLFQELALKEASLKAVQAMGFESPTEIQQKSIPILLNDHIDFIGQAQTGTGKTAAFTLPLLERIDFSLNKVQALIIAPTRELANQITTEIDKLAKFEPVRSICLYGGTSVGLQIKDLKRARPHIVVGTAGRLMDFINRDILKLDACETVILDEADEMLDMGFFDDINEILSKIENKKVWMFSATMPKPILGLIKKHFCDPELVKVTKKILTSDAVDQKYVVVRHKDMAESLCRVLDYTKEFYAIVFCNTKIQTKELSDELNLRGYPADALHGDMSQDQRDLTMKKFKDKKIDLLVCTDVAARGIDVTDLTHVINYGLPQDNESYVHRIGRTGRAGNKGIALSIVSPSDVGKIYQVERITKAKIQKVVLPTVAKIKETILEKACEKFSKNFDKEFNADESFIAFAEKFEDASREDLLQGVYSFIFENSLKRYKKAVELDVKLSERVNSSNNASQAGFERFFFNFGTLDGIDTGALVRYLSESLDIPGRDIGKIMMRDSFSFFEVPVKFKEKVLSLKNAKWLDRKISVDVAKSSRGGGRSGGRSGGGAGRRNGNRSGGSGRSANGGRRRQYQ